MMFLINSRFLLAILSCPVISLAQEYLGCFKSSSSEPDLPSVALNHASNPSECVKECLSRYYMYAGLMNGEECYCGSQYGRNGVSNACTIPCSNDPTAFCGTKEAMSIYTTGQKGPSPPRRFRVTKSTSDSLELIWQPPDIPNGNVTSYNLRAEVVETHAMDPLPPIEAQVQGGSSNHTVLRNLHPGTKYKVTIVAVNLEEASESTYVTDWTLIGTPNKPSTPKILEKSGTTMTIEITEGSSDAGPVTSYRVLVVQAGIIPPLDDEEYPHYRKSVQDGLGYYTAAEFSAYDFHSYKRFVVGDGKLIGGFYNAPLTLDTSTPQIGIAVVSKAMGETRLAYSDLTTSGRNFVRWNETGSSSRMDATAIGLCVAIALLGALLVASIVAYFTLRRKHMKIPMRKLPEQQELTLQGPMYEVDNMGYIPEDVPERVNHYQELKSKVWSIPRSALTIEPVVIRRGRFGSIHMGTVQKDEDFHTVVIHTIADGLLKASEKRHMLRELDVCIKGGRMKYLAGLIGTCETPDTLYVVLELPAQTLKSKLLASRSGDIFPVEKMLPIASGVAEALRHLEYQKIVHSHFCARSVGVSNDWQPKVMGHGISKYALEDMKYARWTALEAFSNQKRQQSAVVWAFGVFLWEMFSMGGTPYSNLPLDSDVEDALNRGERLQQLMDVPDPLYQVMLSCWQADPQERPTFDELIRVNTLSVCPITSVTEPYLPELELNE